jgi:hypothetical protein
MSTDSNDLKQDDLLRIQRALVALVTPLSESLEAITELRLRAPEETDTQSEGTNGTGAAANGRRASHRDPHCSFCGRDRKSTTNLIAGSGAYICTECVELCNQIIRESAAKDADEDVDGTNTDTSAPTEASAPSAASVPDPDAAA